MLQMISCARIHIPHHAFVKCLNAIQKVCNGHNERSEESIRCLTKSQIIWFAIFGYKTAWLCDRSYIETLDIHTTVKPVFRTT